MLSSRERNTEKCLIVPKMQTGADSPFTMFAGTEFNDYAAHVTSTPFGDSDIVAAIPCLDGTRILNSFGVGFGRGEIVIEIFCGDVVSGSGAAATGAFIAQQAFDEVRISGENGDQGMTVTGKGANFLFFPDTLKISGFDASRGVVQAQMGGFAYTQSGGKK